MSLYIDSVLVLPSKFIPYFLPTLDKAFLKSDFDKILLLTNSNNIFIDPFTPPTDDISFSVLPLPNNNLPTPSGDFFNESFILLDIFLAVVKLADAQTFPVFNT